MSAHYAEGEPLPALRELETQYGLGKDAINRVFAALEGEGLIVRNGRRRYPVLRHRSEDRVIALEHVFRTNEHPFFGPMNGGIIDTLLASEYGVHLFTHRETTKPSLTNGAVMSNLLERRILRGMIFPFSIPLPDGARDKGVSICTVGIMPGPGVILIDVEQAALQATHYMAKLGFDHIGIVCSLSITRHIDVNGYCQALALNDLPCRDEDIIDCSEFFLPTVADYREHNIPYDIFRRESLKAMRESARQAVLRRIKDGSFPRALYISDEFHAIGTMLALQEMGLRVPQDVAIVSQMSSGNWAVELSGLTTVQFNGYDCGMEAAQFMIDIVEGRRSPDDRLTLQARLVKGMSCGELDDLKDVDKVM